MTNGKQREPEQQQQQRQQGGGLPSSVTIVNESTPLVQHGRSNNSRSGSQQRHAVRVLSLSTEPSLRKKELTGIAVLTVSATALAASSLFVKLSEALSLNFLEIALARASLQTAFALVGCIFLTINPLGPDARVRIWLLTRGFVGAIGILLFYYSLSKLALAEATVLFFLGPAFTSVLLGIFTNEPFTLFEGFCTIFCTAGVVLLIQPPQVFGCTSDIPDCMEGHAKRASSVACALLGAVMSAVAYITARKSGRGTHFMVHAFYTGFVTSVVCIAGLAATGSYTLTKDLTAKQYIHLASVAALSCIGQTFLNKGLKLAPQGPGILLQMAEVVFALLFGIDVLQEYPNTYSLLGSALIVGMTTALSVHRWQMAASLKISNRTRQQRHSRGERPESVADDV